MKHQTRHNNVNCISLNMHSLTINSKTRNIRTPLKTARVETGETNDRVDK